ncbi:acyl-CoA N-acyltransferase [Ascobolus immersus RN42]|uniref:Glucosamine 6-phosphate N-acetyltransferase n=1 Tax=Ascobolus immersus RN42 TaxID=1160509 RepID=A0A3N4IQN8_ASCIM|nr:acyl-CoA N-acyltransferase [Ascobolus immersus RN42]
MSTFLSNATPSCPVTPLFAASLLPTPGKDTPTALPENYKLRPLNKQDYTKGFLDVLRQLTTVGDITEEQWNERYDWMKKREGEYFVVAIEDGEGKVVGCGTLVVERKFLRNLGLVGHIEDIAVDSNQRKKNLGKIIIETLDFLAKNAGCYKSILDCSEHNVGFYEKCGHKVAGTQMAQYYGDSKPKQ